MSVEKLAAQSLDKDSKGEDQRRMMTPWRSRIVVGLEALPLLLLSPCLIKLLRQGLYDGAGFVDLASKNLHLFRASGWRAGVSAPRGVCSRRSGLNPENQRLKADLL
jgi:hypothetical protein